MTGEVITQAANWIFSEYQSVVSLLPQWSQSLISLFALSMLVSLYVVIVWHGYRFLSKKDPLGLNLNKYNTYQRPFFTKLVKGSLYFVEYIIISPFMIFVGFSVFTIMLALLSQNLVAKQILLISATIIAVIRITAYYKEDLSKDIAKLIPFTLLAVALSNFLNLKKIFTSFAEIPTLIGDIGIYLLFIIGLEIILRFFDFIFSLFNLEEVEVEKED